MAWSKFDGATAVHHILSWIGWQERLRRSVFWWKLIVATATFVLLFVFLQSVAGYASTLVLYPPLFAVLLSLAVRRLHDREHAAWWLLLALVPVLGPVVLACQLLFARGTRGENRYGADPRLRTRDYLQVRIHEPA